MVPWLRDVSSWNLLLLFGAAQQYSVWKCYRVRDLLTFKQENFFLTTFTLYNTIWDNLDGMTDIFRAASLARGWIESNRTQPANQQQTVVTVVAAAWSGSDFFRGSRKKNFCHAIRRFSKNRKGKWRKKNFSPFSLPLSSLYGYTSMYAFCTLCMENIYIGIVCAYVWEEHAVGSISFRYGYILGLIILTSRFSILIKREFFSAVLDSSCSCLAINAAVNWLTLASNSLAICSSFFLTKLP